MISSYNNELAFFQSNARGDNYLGFPVIGQPLIQVYCFFPQIYAPT